MSDKTFLTDCVSCPGPDPGQAINDMQDADTEITRRTFLKHVRREELSQLERSLGYEKYAASGLTMAGDWHVYYAKSTFRGQPCVFFTHSAIEYIFV